MRRWRVWAGRAGGKIIIGGAFIGVGAVALTNMARLYPDGGLDLSFNPSDAVATADLSWEAILGPRSLGSPATARL